MKVVELGEGELRLQAENAVEAVWLARNADVEINGETVEATIRTAPAAPRPRARLTPEQHAARQAAYDETKSDAEAGARVGIAATAFAQWRHVQGLPAKHAVVQDVLPVKRADAAPAANGGGPVIPKAQPSASRSGASGTPPGGTSPADDLLVAALDSEGREVFSPGAMAEVARPAFRKITLAPDDRPPDESVDEADLLFRIQGDRRVAFLPHGKTVLVDVREKDKVGHGERWRVRLDHRPTVAIARPVERIALRERPAPEARRPVPKAVPAAPKKPDPMECMVCHRRKAILGDGSFGHRSAEDRAHHERMVKKVAAS